MDGKTRICKSEIKMAASKHVTKLKVNGVPWWKTRPRDHTFTSGNSQLHYLDQSNNISPKHIL